MEKAKEDVLAVNRQRFEPIQYLATSLVLDLGQTPDLIQAFKLGGISLAGRHGKPTTQMINEDWYRALFWTASSCLKRCRQKQSQSIPMVRTLADFCHFPLPVKLSAAIHLH